MSESKVQFVTDKNGRKTHVLIPIETYEKLLALRTLVKHTAKPNDQEIYSFDIKNASARGYPTGVRSKPGFVILKGSQAVLQPVQSTPAHVQALREKFLEDGTLVLDPYNNCFTFSRDLKLSSASIAATLVAGNVRNGLDVWINREGFSLKSSGYGKNIKKKQPKD